MVGAILFFCLYYTFYRQSVSKSRKKRECCVDR